MAYALVYSGRRCGEAEWAYPARGRSHDREPASGHAWVQQAPGAIDTVPRTRQAGPMAQRSIHVPVWSALRGPERFGRRGHRGRRKQLPWLASAMSRPRPGNRSAGISAWSVPCRRCCLCSMYSCSGQAAPGRAGPTFSVRSTPDCISVSPEVYCLSLRASAWRWCCTHFNSPWFSCWRAIGESAGSPSEPAVSVWPTTGNDSSDYSTGRRKRKTPWRRSPDTTAPDKCSSGVCCLFRE